MAERLAVKAHGCLTIILELHSTTITSKLPDWDLRHHLGPRRQDYYKSIFSKRGLLQVSVFVREVNVKTAEERNGLEAPKGGCGDDCPDRD